MDTRNKIIPLAEAAARIAAEALTPVQLDCDPLLAPVLAQLGTPLYAFIGEHDHPYLSAQARAELAASLKQVRYVSLGFWPGATDLRSEEAAARRDLEQLVIRKSEVR
ncbi:MAG: hypothetical protein FJW36_10260 [Acidobacteria bacterium]|nr:hypothetical protein [Acidobacteriota bacterium]